MTQNKGAVGQFNSKPSLHDRRKNMRFRINTTSTSETGVVPIRGAQKYPDEPTIYFTREAWVKQCHLVKICNKEVGWFALVDYDEKDNAFTITELVIPAQEVTAAETDIGKEDLADAAMELIEQGKDTSKMYAWFHSHVNMGVSPSGQDEFQVEDFLEDLADQPEVPAFIRGIQNKSGKLKLDVYYIQHGIAYQNLDFYVLHDDDPAWKTDIEAQVKTKVTERVQTYTNYGWQNGKKANAAGGNSDQGSRFHNGSQYSQGFRSPYGGYDGYGGFGGYDDEWYDDRPYSSGNAASPVQAMDYEDDDLPEPLTDPQLNPYEMDIIYMTDGIEVLQDTDNKLYVCDEIGKLYSYDDYIEYYGDLDSHVANDKQLVTT